MKNSRPSTARTSPAKLLTPIWPCTSSKTPWNGPPPLNPAKIRDALAATDLTSGPGMIVGYDAVEFDATGQNKHAALVIVQINDMGKGLERITVWPKSATSCRLHPGLPHAPEKPRTRYLTPPAGDSRPEPQPHTRIGTSTCFIILEDAINGILMGSIYGLAALGLTLIFGVLKVINFAHGSLLMVSMYVAYWTVALTGLHPYLAIIIVAPIMFGFGYLPAGHRDQAHLQGGEECPGTHHRHHRHHGRLVHPRQPRPAHLRSPIPEPAG